MAATGMDAEDVGELQRLIADCRRDTVRASLQALLPTAPAQAAAASKPVPEPIGVAAVVEPTLRYTTLKNYAWDQNKANVKLYVTLSGCHEVPSENIEFECEERLVVLKAHGIKGQNYQFRLELADKINASTSFMRVKTNQLRLILKKAAPDQHWAHVSFKEKSAADARKPKLDSAKEDPSASIMGMMKQMYDDGDDDMKRTIAKAWTESRDKSGGGGGAAPF